MLRRNDYVEACKELQGILKAIYVGAPKPFQALLYEDVVHAFRTLPGYATSTSAHFRVIHIVWFLELEQLNMISGCIYSGLCGLVTWVTVHVEVEVNT